LASAKNTGTPSLEKLSANTFRVTVLPVPVAPAINLVNSCFLSHGDEVWVADNIYGPNMEHLRNLEKRYGIGVRIYNPIDVSSFQPTEKAKLIWLEAAGSVTLEFPDLVGLVKKAQTHHVRTALDNTWGAGLAFNALNSAACSLT
jgi:cysteine-S-conjugate beta-lyase